MKITTDESKIYEKYCGKKICTENLNIEGFKKPIPFDIYDGYAVCLDHGGHRFDLVYPTLKAISESKELSDAIIDYVGDISNKYEISVIHILITFSTLYKDGVEIKPKKK